MSVQGISLVELAGAIDQIGIPLILAWFMIRMENVLRENTDAIRDLSMIVAKLVDKVGD